MIKFKTNRKEYKASGITGVIGMILMIPAILIAIISCLICLVLAIPGFLIAMIQAKEIPVEEY